jgi:hypothetical protein
MDKPSALATLIDELRAEILDSDVGTLKDSRATIYLTDDAAANEDGIELNRQECQLLLHSATTVDQLLEALGAPKEAFIELFEVDVTDVVMDALERHFVAVDEA